MKPNKKAYLFGGNNKVLNTLKSRHKNVEVCSTDPWEGTEDI